MKTNFSRHAACPAFTSFLANPTRAAVAMAIGCALAFGTGGLVAADNAEAKTAKERKLVDLLQSDAPPQDKAIACKQLAVCGSKNAVPALASLLPNPQLSSWARIALEAIPDPAADQALREAVGKLDGRLLTGVINSIGNRRDENAVDALAGKLKSSDVEVASAAAVALGRIGGSTAADALKLSLAGAMPAVRSAVAEGCIRCAEGFLGSGKRPDAIALFDTVRQADLPKQRIAEATRGAILARQSDGFPLLLEQLNSPDKALFAVGLRAARELGGADVTKTLASSMTRLDPDRQPLVLMALADRNDPAVLPTVRDAARSGSKKLRATGINLLERLGDVSCVPLLLDAAAGADPDLAAAAKNTLLKMGGSDVEDYLVGSLARSTGATRRVLLELAGQRNLQSALPAVVGAATDASPAVRMAAVQAIASMGGAGQVAELVKLLPTTSEPKERDSIGQALVAVSGRAGAVSTRDVLPLAAHADAAVRIVALQALAAVGGPEALAAVRTAVSDPDETVQDEAVRTLATWPNNWPEDSAAAEALLELVKSGKKTSHQVLGARGYLECVRADKKLKDDQKLAKVDDLLPLMKLAEEKRFAITVLGALPIPGSLELLTNLASDPPIAEEACSAIVSLAGKNLAGVTKEQRLKALESALAASKNDATRKKAQEALNNIR